MILIIRSVSESSSNLMPNRHCIHSTWGREQLSRISLLRKIILLTIFSLLKDVKIICRRVKVRSCIFELFIIWRVVLINATIDWSVFEGERMPPIVCRVCGLRYVVVTHCVHINQIDLQVFSCTAFMIAQSRSACPGFRAD